MQTTSRPNWPRASRSSPVIAIAYSTGQFYLSAEIGWSAIASGAMGGAAAGAASSALYGGNLEQTFNSAARGAVSGALFGWAGGQGANPNDFARYAAHAGAGCVSAVAKGNDCGGGAASAVFCKWATNRTDGWGPGTAQFTAAVVAGGVGSDIAGGKFENGATTAAYGYLFNQLMSEMSAANRSPRPVQYGGLSEIREHLNWLSMTQDGVEMMRNPQMKDTAAMFLRLEAGMSSDYDSAFYHHERAEAMEMRSFHSQPAQTQSERDYLMRMQSRAHQHVLQNQGNNEYHLYHPVVVHGSETRHLFSPKWKS